MAASFEELAQLAGSDEPADVDRAHALALSGMQGDPRLRPIAAMAYDRARALAGRPQKFGTQAVLRGDARVLWPVDDATTDSERAKWALGTLQSLLARVVDAPLVSKRALRRLLRGRRRTIEPAHAEAWSYVICDHGLDALAPRAQVVAAYWPLPGEADPRPLARALARRVRARLALPVVDGERMRFREWIDDASLEPAGFGTYGPCAAAPELVPTIVLAPLCGFDASGARLGQGKGYYDRKLAELAAARPFVVGVGFACQQLPIVPTEAHDRPLDAILTERGLMTPRASA